VICDSFIAWLGVALFATGGLSQRRYGSAKIQLLFVKSANGPIFSRFIRFDETKCLLLQRILRTQTFNNYTP